MSQNFTHGTVYEEYPMAVRLSDYPQLKLIAWQRSGDDIVEEKEALALYERNWRYIDLNQLTEAEQQFIDHLVKKHGRGVLHV
jgi:hypothetical protein